MSENILVTGGSGFIGTHLVTALKELNYNVLNLDKVNHKDCYDIEDYCVDFKPKFIFHLAASTSVFNTNDDEIIHNNISALKKVIDYANKVNATLIFTSSSTAALDNATSMYGLSKRYGEDIIRIYSKSYVIMRLHNVYGLNSREDTLLGIILKNIKENKPITLFNNGQNKRHFTYVDDVVKTLLSGMTLCNDKKFANETYNIFNPQCCTILQYCEEIKKHYPNLEIQLDNDKRKFDREFQTPDLKFKNIIKQPTSIEEGIKLSLKK